MRSRRLVAAIGAVVAAVGVAGALAPRIALALPVPSVPVVIVGALAGLLTLVVAGRRRDVEFHAADPPVVEDAVDHPTPGAAFDDTLAGATSIGVQAARLRRESRERLHDVAVDVLVTADGRSPAGAEQALADGTWTDDPVAARYFADEGVVDDDRSVRERLRAAIFAPTSQRAEIERAVAELSRHTRRDDR